MTEDIGLYVGAWLLAIDTVVRKHLFLTIWRYVARTERSTLSVSLFNDNKRAVHSQHYGPYDLFRLAVKYVLARYTHQVRRWPYTRLSPNGFSLLSNCGRQVPLSGLNAN